MKTVGRIIIVSGLLIGGTFAFRFWALQEFNFTLDTMLANVAKSSTVFVSARVLPTIATSTSTATSTASTTIELATSTSVFTGLRFVFPTGKSHLYQGCSYIVTWQSSSTIETMNISLVDAGTLKTAGPIAGGLPGTTTISADQNFPWKIGNVWPGRYSVFISNVNGTTTKIRSSQFEINQLPSSVLNSQRDEFCVSQGSTTPIQ